MEIQEVLTPYIKQILFNSGLKPTFFNTFLNKIQNSHFPEEKKTGKKTFKTGIMVAWI